MPKLTKITPPRRLTLADHLDKAIDRIVEILPMAHDERRRTDQTDGLIDDIVEIGESLIRAARGRG